MKLRGQEKLKAENKIRELFPDCSFDANAPQGKNSFSCNYLLKKGGQQDLLKVLVRNKIKGTVNQEQAFSEVEIHKTVNSQYMVPLKDCVRDENFIFLRFPFLDGKNLKDYADGKRFNEEQIIEIGINILRGISDLYRKGIVHQDMKPDNIFIERTGSLKILDFGSARFQISPCRGVTRANFAYCSPEQIIASRPVNIELLRKTIDDRADVYAVGLILYWLIEGHHPFESDDFPACAILEGKSIPDFTNTDISDGLKKVVLLMLDINLVNRPHASLAISYLENKNITMPKLQKGGFYYCVINGLARFTELKNSALDLLDGVVVEASQIPEDKDKRSRLRININTILVDPQTYLFQNPVYQSLKFKKLPYFKYNDEFSNPSSFVKKIQNRDPIVKNFISDVINYQLQVGVNAIIPPFFYIKEFHDKSWDIDQELSNVSINGFVGEETTKPIVKGLAISQGILTSDQSRRCILEYLTSYSDRIDGYLILLESSHSKVIKDKSWIRGARDLFIKLLSTGKYVIWSRADFVGLTFAPIGIGVATGEMLKQRRFNIAEEKQTGGKNVPFYYLQGMFANATWPDVMKALAVYKKANDFVCVKKCCSNVDFSVLGTRRISDLGAHMMHAVSDQFRKYQVSGGGMRLRDDINKAKIYYDEIKNHPELIVREALRKNIKPASESFLENWLNTLDA